MSLQVRRHGPVINNIYRHHRVFDVHAITVRTLCLASNTINCDLRRHIYCFNVFNIVKPREIFHINYFSSNFDSVLHNNS